MLELLHLVLSEKVLPPGLILTQQGISDQVHEMVTVLLDETSPSLGLRICTHSLTTGTRLHPLSCRPKEKNRPAASYTRYEHAKARYP